MTISQITARLTQIWQAKLKEKKLVKSGHLLASIKFIDAGTSIQMQAEDYYQYLDTKYSISKEIIATQEFKDLIAQYQSIKIEAELKKPI